MRPASKKTDNQKEMFRERLDNILNRHHELCKLAALIDWEAFERKFGILYADKNCRPVIPIRLLVGLSYLGHALGLSDQAVVDGWVKILTGSISLVKHTSSTSCPLIRHRCHDGANESARKAVKRFWPRQSMPESAVEPSESRVSKKGSVCPHFYLKSTLNPDEPQFTD